MRGWLGVALAFALVGSSAAQGLKVDPPPPITPTPLSPDTKTKPVSLTRLAANIAPGARWLEETKSPYFMVPCVSTGDVTLWVEANNKIDGIETFDRIFRDQLKGQGFRTAGDPTNLFEDQASADLQVGALVTDLKIKICNYVTLVNATFQGAAVMDVEWQIYSVSQAKVLARIKTHGGTTIKGAKQGAGTALLQAAFADNAQRLAANEAFRQIIAGATPSASALPASLMAFKAAPAGDVPLATAVKSVVSIFAGDGMGSGVAISTDGYILTNHHVAGSSGQVRVRWPDGAESVGEVVRSDRRRDVALIKTTPKAPPLPVRGPPVQVGETVFAVGTPLRKEFSNTLTRGVVSATRQIEGQAVIQSDVAVDHGNSGGPLLDEKGRIVALTVSGYSEDGVGRNINFFIPIEDALKALALTPAP